MTGKNRDNIQIVFQRTQLRCLDKVLMYSSHQIKISHFHSSGPVATGAPMTFSYLRKWSFTDGKISTQWRYTGSSRWPFVATLHWLACYNPNGHKVMHVCVCVCFFFFLPKCLLFLYLFIVSQSCPSTEAHSWRSGCPCNAWQIYFCKGKARNQRAWDTKIGLWSTCCINLICLLWIIHFVGGRQLHWILRWEMTQ